MMLSLFINDVSSGVPAMDKLHHDFFMALDMLATSSNEEFRERYESFVNQIEQAFREEEQWMEEIDFPALRHHREQHARVLGALHNTHFHVMNGEIQQGREIVDRLLPQWFVLHASTMDATLAHAMNLSSGEDARCTPPSHNRTGQTGTLKYAVGIQRDDT